MSSSKLAAASEPQPAVILAVAAHPDDLEFGVAGSIAKWVKAGAKAYYLVFTDGSKGSADRTAVAAELIRCRRQEQQAAADILGVAEVFFLDYEDGMLQVARPLKLDIARLIRRLRPDVVMAMDPTFVYSTTYNFVNHTDHRAAGQATLDAVFPLARDHLSFPELLAEGLEPHKVKTLLLTNFDKHNCFVDITDTFETKMQALAAHASQIPGLGAAQAKLHSLAAERGRQAGCKLAESFVRIDLPK
ncbi:MAG TPA: PIG-L deacetylase family protein [Candidatus Saccharimonadales bacterium]|nr:PIG-L deacetylase family protein [Candidatus Saccharimonadales bacterium]